MTSSRLLQVDTKMKSLLIVACLLSAVAGYTSWDTPRRIGQSNLKPDSRISNGVDVDISEVPYMVALETKGNKAQQYCGGALISESHVLTACQCLIRSPDKLRIRVGSQKRNSGGTVYDIAKHECHSKFNRNTFDYDVGILHLETKVKLGDNVKTIKVTDVAPTNGTVRIAGWGMKEEEGELSPMLQKADPSLMQWNDCNDIFKMFLLSITDRMMCTQGNGTDACVGDGGGPAVVNGHVTGIISWGVGCGRPFFPAVQVNVANPEIRAFIRQQANV